MHGKIIYGGKDYKALVFIFSRLYCVYIKLKLKLELALDRLATVFHVEMFAIMHGAGKILARDGISSSIVSFYS